MTEPFDIERTIAGWFAVPTTDPPPRCAFRRYGLFRGEVRTCDDYALPGELWCADHLHDHDPGCPTWRVPTGV